MLGDFDVHNKLWLRHFSSNTVEGTALKQVCDEAGLTQKVTKPSRDEHLLDLVLTDIPGTTTQVSAGIADHKIIIAELTSSYNKFQSQGPPTLLWYIILFKQIGSPYLPPHTTTACRPAGYASNILSMSPRSRFALNLASSRCAFPRSNTPETLEQ